MTTAGRIWQCFSTAGAHITAASLVLLLACSPMRPSPRAAADRTSGPLPIARPFALERGGETATFEVDVPDTRLDGHLRSVFLGVRAVHDPRAPGADASGRRIYRYLDEAALPMRVVIEQRIDGAWRPLTPMKMTMAADRSARGYSYVAHPDPVFRHHRPAHWDGDELVGAGLWDFDLAYFEHEIAAFGDYAPGRYRISVTSLEAHPALQGGRFELVVAHRRRY